MQHRSRRGSVLMVLAGVLILGWLLYTQLRPVVESAAAYQAQVYAARIVNDAVLGELARETVGYEDLVNLSRGETGEILALESNMLAINRLKAEITRAVIEKLEGMGSTSLYLPLGTLMGGALTSGRGPLMEVRIIPAGSIQTELYSQFTDAGINQTLHQVMLGIRVEMRALIPGYHIQCETSTSYCIAQTVIVGGIPQVYAQLGGDSAPLISRIEEAGQVP